MGYKKVLGSIVFLTVVLSGCSSFDDVKRDVKSSNIKVEENLLEYEKSKDVAIEIESLILDGIATGRTKDLINTVALKNNTLLSMEIEDFVLTSHEQLKNDISVINSNYEMYKNDSTANRDLPKRIDNPSEYINTHVETHYFLDDTNTSTEQLMFIDLPETELQKLSLTWVGGVLVDFETDFNR